jgi:glutaredoxin
MSAQPLRLELYTRPGCHLCDELKSLCERLAGEFSIQVAEVNIEADPELRARFDQEIPVLFIDGRKAVKYRTTEDALRRLLRRRLLFRRVFGV